MPCTDGLNNKASPRPSHQPHLVPWKSWRDSHNMWMGRPFLHQPNPGVNLGMPDSGCADGLLDSNCAGLDLGWALACRWPQLGRRQFRMTKFKKNDRPSPKFWNQRAETEVPFLSPENGLQIGAAWTFSKRRLPRFRAPK